MDRFLSQSMIVLFNPERETVIGSPTWSPGLSETTTTPGRYHPPPFRSPRSTHATSVITTPALVYEHYFNHNDQPRPFDDTFRGLWEAQGLRR